MVSFFNKMAVFSFNMRTLKTKGKCKMNYFFFLKKLFKAKCSVFYNRVLGFQLIEVLPPLHEHLMTYYHEVTFTPLFLFFPLHLIMCVFFCLYSPRFGHIIALWNKRLLMMRKKRKIKNQRPQTHQMWVVAVMMSLIRFFFLTQDNCNQRTISHFFLA